MACYDAIARAAQAEHVAPARAAAPPAVPPAAAASPPAPSLRAEFGLSAAEREELRPAQERQLERVLATIAAAARVGAGYWRYRMEDGTVWQLIENRRAFRTPQPGDAVVIRRGSLGSYFLDADGQQGMRIKRVD